MAPAICGETLKRPGSLTSTSLPLPSISTMLTSPSPWSAPLRPLQRDRLEPLRHALDRRFVAQEDAQALLHLRRRLIERLDRLDARAHFVALHFGGEEQQHRGARLEQVAILRQAFGEQHRLVVAARIGEADNAHLGAVLGAPLGARHDRAGDAAGAGAAPSRRAKTPTRTARAAA